VNLQAWKAWIGADVACCGAGYATLSRGDTGANVGWWQVALDHWLVSHSETALVVDTVFGPLTMKGTMRFQRAAHLPATGVADGRTWRALSKTPDGLKLN
jgi:peptidoglycan hydrolase-like protein with peptidoglycan-binding domain